MSAVEKLIGEWFDCRFGEWESNGTVTMTEDSYLDLLDWLRNPAVIAELFAETLSERDIRWLRAFVLYDDKLSMVIGDLGGQNEDALPQSSNLRRLLTQEGGEQDGHSPVETSEPATPDLRELYWDLLSQVSKVVPGETRHETARRIIHQHENPPCSGPAKSSLLPKEESDGDSR